MKKSFASLLILLTLLAVWGAAPAAAADKPQPREITAKMSCGVCGMYPARFPQWQAEIIFNDNTMVPFDGPKDMFKYLLMLNRYNRDRTRADVAAIWVKDHQSNTWIDGETAYFLVGSDIRGPMGQELVPFSDADQAKGMGDESGGKVITFADVTLESLKTMGPGHMGRM